MLLPRILKNDKFLYSLLCAFGVLAYFYSLSVYAQTALIDIGEYYKDGVKQTVRDQNGRRLPIQTVTVQNGNLQGRILVPRTGGAPPATLTRSLTLGANTMRSMGAACLRQPPACAAAGAVATLIGASGLIDFDPDLGDFVPATTNTGNTPASYPRCTEVRVPASKDNPVAYTPIEVHPCLTAQTSTRIDLRLPLPSGYETSSQALGAVAAFYAGIPNYVVPNTTVTVRTSPSVLTDMYTLRVSSEAFHLPIPVFEQSEVSDEDVASILRPEAFLVDGEVPGFFDVFIDYDSLPDFDDWAPDESNDKYVLCELDENGDLVEGCEIEDVELIEREFDLFNFFTDREGSSWMPSQCPNPTDIYLSTFNRNFSISYDAACIGAEMARPFVIFVGAFLWFVIVFRNL